MDAQCRKPSVLGHWALFLQRLCRQGLKQNAGIKLVLHDRFQTRYLRWRILLRIFRFFRPSFRRPFPVFLTPIPHTLPSSFQMKLAE